MTNDQKQNFLKFLNVNRDVFAADLSELGKCNVGEHKIETTDNIPIRVPPNRAKPKVKAEIEKQIDKMLENTIIEPSTSSYNSPVVLCQK